jgi:hypothetical protein
MIRIFSRGDVATGRFFLVRVRGDALKRALHGLFRLKIVLA